MQCQRLCIEKGNRKYFEALIQNTKAIENKKTQKPKPSVSKTKYFAGYSTSLMRIISPFKKPNSLIL